MAEIIKTYRQNIEAARFIGKKYDDNDRVNGMFGTKWGEWFEKDWFTVIEKQAGESTGKICKDDNAYIGMMRDKDGKFEYWIGMFTPENTALPDQYSYIDFPAGELGVCWIYGKEDEIYGLEWKCGDHLKAEGFEASGDWCFERYACPRFTSPDEKGNVILDICFYLK